MKTITEEIKKVERESLGKLIREINSHFKVHKKTCFSIVMWELRCWQNGYWSVEVIDDWHKWMKKRISLPSLQYLTPEMACIEFLKFIKRNKINIRSLQGK
jgi:hypothetical protein